MANVVVAMADFWGSKRIDEIVFPPFYDCLINSLLENNNNVQVFINPVYKYSFTNNIPKDILENLKNFSPDLFIFFNNNFWDISKHFDCPIIIYDVDSPNAYANIDFIKKNKERLKFVVQQKNGIEWTSDAIGINKNKIEYILPFTSIKNIKTSKKRNICFCGSVWLWDGCKAILDFLKKQPNDDDIEFARICFEELIKNPMKSINEIYTEIGVKNQFFPEKILILNDQRSFIGRYSGIRRADILQEIADLGLNIYGKYWIQNSLCYFPDLALRYSHTPICTTQETQNIFNQSKIGIQIGHIQAKSGFSWKVIDIMASDACLVTNFSSDLNALYKGKLPMYKTKSEAREICIDLLKNENKRQDIIAISNNIIEEKCRPQRALEQLSHISNINLLSNNKNNLINNSLKINALYQPIIGYLEGNKYKGIKKIKYKIWHHLNKQFADYKGGKNENFKYF